jgi:hypothetical protein
MGSILWIKFVLDTPYGDPIPLLPVLMEFHFSLLDHILFELLHVLSFHYVFLLSHILTEPQSLTIPDFLEAVTLDLAFISPSKIPDG